MMLLGHGEIVIEVNVNCRHKLVFIRVDCFELVALILCERVRVAFANRAKVQATSQQQTDEQR
jgi:hypothetical protein